MSSERFEQLSMGMQGIAAGKAMVEMRPGSGTGFGLDFSVAIGPVATDSIL